MEISKIVFPYVMILSQDCDLQQHFRDNTTTRILSAIVAPLYNEQHVYEGSQLSQLGITMRTINKNKTEGDYLRKNINPRYHYLEFPPEVNIVNSVIDFKHYFSVDIRYLSNIRKRNFVCRISELYREDISQRFASFLSRIGLPD